MIRIRDLMDEDRDFVLACNRDNVEVLSPMDQDKLEYFRENSEMFRVVTIDDEPAAFLIVLREGLDDYTSENYIWFNGKYQRFLYVDRIVIDEKFRRYGIGKALYEEVFAHARSTDVPVVTAEIDIRPYNEPSLRFHERMGFREVGQQVIRGGQIEVSLQARTDIGRIREVDHESSRSFLDTVSAR